MPLRDVLVRKREPGRHVGVLHAREHLCAALLVFVVVLVELWPALVNGQLLSPTSLLYLFVPWSAYVPLNAPISYNPLLSDVPTAVYPWAFLARSLIRHGIFPAWNPYALTGTPFFANPQPAWFCPFSLPLWILSLNYAFGVAAALKLWTAGFGTYLLVRELGLRFWPGIVAGVSFMLCAFNVVWMTHGDLVSVAALLPWMIWLTDRIVCRGRRSDGAWLAVATGFMFSGGHPGTEVHVVAATTLYAIGKTIVIHEPAMRNRWRRLAMIGGGMALGGLLLCVTLVPTLRAIPGTAGELTRRDGAPTMPGGVMPLSIAKTILFPDWWGRPSAVNLGGPANYNERTLYAGTVAVLLACLALLIPGAWRRKAPFVAIAAIGLAAPLDVQPLRLFLTHVPPFDSVQNQRMLMLFMFGTAVLAAFGAEAALSAPRPAWRTRGIVGAGVLAAAVGVAAVSPTSSDLGQTLSHFATGADDTTVRVIELTSVMWWLVWTVGVALVLVLLTRWSRLASYAPPLLALLVAGDMLHFAHGYQPMGPPSQTIPPRPQAVTYLQRHAAAGRVTGVGATLLNDWTTVYGLRDVRGYDAPQPSLRFERLWQLVAPNQLGWQPYEVEHLSEPGLRLLSILGARYLLFEPQHTLGQAREGSPFASLSIAYDGPDATIVENSDAVPRTMVAPALRVVDGEQGTLSALTDHNFNPRDRVIIERGQPDAAHLAATATGGGTAVVTGEANAEVRLRASLPREGLVMLDDQLVSGWTVRVGGHPARALRVDGVMRGVAVPAGTHSVVWSYTVPGLRLGLLLSGLGFVGILAWFAVAYVSRRPQDSVRQVRKDGANSSRTVARTRHSDG
jgi:hypothetical protein